MEGPRERWRHQLRQWYLPREHLRCRRHCQPWKRYRHQRDVCRHLDRLKPVRLVVRLAPAVQHWVGLAMRLAERPTAAMRHRVGLMGPLRCGAGCRTVGQRDATADRSTKGLIAVAAAEVAAAAATAVVAEAVVKVAAMVVATAAAVEAAAAVEVALAAVLTAVAVAVAVVGAAVVAAVAAVGVVARLVVVASVVEPAAASVTAAAAVVAMGAAAVAAATEMAGVAIDAEIADRNHRATCKVVGGSDEAVAETATAGGAERDVTVA